MSRRRVQKSLAAAKNFRKAFRRINFMGETREVTPDAGGHWGPYGGRYVPETLMAPLEELTEAFDTARDDADFHSEFDALLRDYSGRRTPLFRARRLTEHADGARIYLKREDLSHTGSH